MRVPRLVLLLFLSLAILTSRWSMRGKGIELLLLLCTTRGFSHKTRERRRLLIC